MTHENGAVLTLNRHGVVVFDRLLSRPAGCLTAIGGGGKTSLLTALAAAAQRRQIATILTTTTHMRITPEADLSGDLSTIGRIVQEKKLCFCGIPAENGKLKGFSTEKSAQLPALCELLLVEGDGSRGLPLKLPAAGEPVIPEGCDRVVLVVGMSALGQPLEEVCHRWQLGSLPGDTLVTAEVMVQILREGYLRKLEPSGLTVVFHQCDSQEQAAAAEAVGRALGLPFLLTRKENVK